MNVFYTQNLKEHKDALLDWVRLCQLDDKVTCLKMNRFTYDQLKAEVVEEILLSTKDVKDPNKLEVYLTGLPIIFDNSISDYMIKAEEKT